MALTVSVALACFNGSRFIREQLESILAQDRPPDELVIADDGSVDGTLGIVRAVMAEAHGIVVKILQSDVASGDEASGVTANFERAIAACSGDLVMLSDQDDRWHPDRISVALARFEADDGLLLHHGNARLVHASGISTGATLFGALGVTPAALAEINGGRAFDVYLRRNLATGAVVAFRRELFDVAAPLPREWLHDEWLAIMAASAGRICASDRCLIDYRQHGSNQIGVAMPTLWYRVGRMMRPEATRNSALADRSRVLEERLDLLPGIPPEVRARATAKRRFETRRAELPRLRIARIPGILRAARRGSYLKFASQGRLDILRDLLQSR